MLIELITGITLLAGICFILGLALVILEMFLPGIGAPGIIGGILLFLGVLLTAETLLDAVIIIAVILAVLAAALALVLRSASRGTLSRVLILSDSLKKESGYIGTEDLEFFLDREGDVITTLRPAGTADFDGIKLDVVSQGEFISKGARIRVIKVEGRRIVVKEIK